MADKKRTNWMRPDVRQDKQISRWAIIFPVVTLGLLAIGMIVFNIYGRSNYTVGLYDTSHPVASVSFRQATYAPEGQAVRLDDNRMVAVDYTDEGMMVYVTKEDLEGGGGGRPELGAEATDYGRLYLRTREGTYQPLVRRE